MKSKWRSTAMVGVALCCAALFIRLVDRVYPVADWLFWTIAKLWGWQCLLVAAMVGFGNLVLERLLKLPRTQPIERLTLAAAVGALAFGLGMFAAGAAACLGPVWAVVWPVTMLVAGIWGARDSLRALLTEIHALPAQASSVISTAAVAFGTLCLAMVYLGAFSPDAISFDAAWTHLVIAQDYARAGRLVRFDADWPKNLAHFGSVINTWAFLLPGLGPPPVRWMMALHTEFTFFVMTLVGVAGGVCWVAGKHLRGAWAVLFLFPGLFAYDSVLGGGNDHFAAFFVAPAFLAAGHGARTMDRSWWVLFGALAGAALITKYQTLYFLIPLSVLLGAAWARALGRAFGVGMFANATMRELTPAPTRVLLLQDGFSRVRFWLVWPALLITATLVVAAPHFVRNWIFHGNPVYPFAQRLFAASSPQMADSALMAETIISHFGGKPPGDWGARLAEAVELLYKFSLQTHEHPPVFGSIFTLCLPLLLFVPRAGRVRLAAALGLGAVFIWAWTWRVERNLQTVAPLLAIATAGVLVRAWEMGRGGRFAALLLVGVQLIWGGDHFFLQSDRLTSAISLIRSGFDRRASTRFDGYGRDQIAVGRNLPPDAKVLLHNLHTNLGIDRPLLHDGLGFQGLIDSRTFRSPRDLYDRFRAVGVTHVVYHPRYYPAPTMQEEVIFAAFADRHAGTTLAFGSLRVLPMPATAPPAESPYQVLTVGIGGYADGIYDVDQLSAVEIMPGALQRRGTARTLVSSDSAPAHWGSVDAVLLGESGRAVREQSSFKDRFHLVTEYPAFSVWIHQR